MPMIKITKEAHYAIAQGANVPLRARVHPDGSREIWVEQDTLDRLNELKFEGESYSDTILRGIAVARGKN